MQLAHRPDPLARWRYGAAHFAVARLRRFAGLYYQSTFQGVFYSIQDRPLSAKRRNGVRQINRWWNMGYTSSTIAITMIRLLAGDVPEEWAYVVH